MSAPKANSRAVQKLAPESGLRADAHVGRDAGQRLPEPYFADEWVTIYHADCREILPLLDPADHVVTDPPFEAEAHTKQRRALTRATREKPLSFEPLSFELREFCGREFARLARRWILCFCQAEAVQAWREALERGGANYRRACVWIKPDGMPQYSGDRPGMGYESIVCAHAPGKSRWNGGGRHGVFTFNKIGAQDFRAGHQTQKPGALMRELIRLFTDPEDVVIDPFAGSGTTGLACFELGRRCVLIEREEPHCEAIVRRIEAQLPGTQARPRATQAPLFALESAPARATRTAAPSTVDAPAQHDARAGADDAREETSP